MVWLRRFLRAYWRQMLLLMVSSLLSLALGEALIRAFVHSSFQRRLATHDSSFWVPQPDRPDEVFSLHPNAHGLAPMSVDKETKWSFVINRDGFRGRPLRKKTAGVFRVLCLGDSYTFGWGLDEEQDPYPRVIEKVLNQDAPTTQVEVLNLGVPGYNTHMENALLQRVADQYDPGIIVVGYTVNDAEPPGDEGLAPPKVRYRYCSIWLIPFLQQAMNRLLGHTVFSTKENVYDFDYLKAYTTNKRKGEDVRDSLRSMETFCRERNIRLFLCILPDFCRPIDQTYLWPAIHKQIGAWAQEFAIPFRDLLPDFEGRCIEAYHLKGDGHPSALAHQRIGEIIARDLQEIRYVAP